MLDSEPQLTNNSSVKERVLPLTSREDAMRMVGHLERAGRFDAMISYIKICIEHEPELETPQEKHYLTIAYKCAITPHRNALKVANALEQREEARGSEKLHLVKDHRMKIEKRMKTYVYDLIQLLDQNLLPVAVEKEDHISKLFYLRMKADYYRYACEYATGDLQSKMSDAALEAYTESMEICDNYLGSYDPLRIRLVVN
jgi:14-3-3 protein epsilon